MIKDRGTIKWTAMMLPEHVHELRNWWDSDRRISERTADEQQLELMNVTINHALANRLMVKINYYDGSTYIQKLGHIKKFEPHTHTLHLLTPQEKIITININRILETELAE